MAATPVSLPGKSHGQRSLASYSPWGCKESDMTEHAHRTIVQILKVSHHYCHFTDAETENQGH